MVYVWDGEVTSIGGYALAEEKNNSVHKREKVAKAGERGRMPLRVNHEQVNKSLIWVAHHWDLLL